MDICSLVVRGGSSSYVGGDDDVFLGMMDRHGTERKTLSHDNSPSQS